MTTAGPSSQPSPLHTSYTTSVTCPGCKVMFLHRMATHAPRFECLRCGRQYVMVGGEFEEQTEVTEYLLAHNDVTLHGYQPVQSLTPCPCCAALHYLGVPHA